MMKGLSSLRRRWLSGVIMALLSFPRPGLAQAGLSVYTDHLVNGFDDWSWAARNLANTAPVHSGSDSISVTASTWQALWLHHGNFDTTLYTNLTFWINGGPGGGQVVQAVGVLGGT